MRIATLKAEGSECNRVQSLLLSVATLTVYKRGFGGGFDAGGGVTGGEGLQQGLAGGIGREGVNDGEADGFAVGFQQPVQAVVGVGVADSREGEDDGF